MPDIDLFELTSSLAERLYRRDWLLATAESCTGGLIAARCTDLAGSSRWFERGFVTYSNQAKQEMLGVDVALIERHGAVSREVVEAMASGALANSAAQISVAVSGIAGPDGGTPDKPVGSVWLAWAVANWRVDSELRHFDGDRAQVREQVVIAALAGLVERSG